MERVVNAMTAAAGGEVHFGRTCHEEGGIVAIDMVDRGKLLVDRPVALSHGPDLGHRGLADGTEDHRMLEDSRAEP